MRISKFTSISILALSSLLVVFIAAGCSSPPTDGKPLSMTRGAAPNTKSITVFQPTA